MVTEPTQKRLPRITTALVISAVVLPVSAIAFAVAYQQDDPFLAVVWMTAILPAAWVVVASF